jgi:hypothetical protein
MTVKEIIDRELNQLKIEIIDRHIRAGQRATGRTAKSLVVTTQDMSGQLSGAEYIGVLEKGRKKGKVPYDFKNLLIRWAKAKGITFGSQKELNTFAYFLSKRIQKEGTSRFYKNEDIFTTPVKEMTDRVTKEISKLYTTQIKETIYGKPQ